MIPHFRRITSSGKFIQYFTMEPNIVALQKQIRFRANNLGMKQLDILVGRWANINTPKMTHEELIDFNDSVLTAETPDLYKALLDHKAPMPTDKYLKAIKLWGLSKK